MSQSEECNLTLPQEKEPVEKQEFVPLFNEEDLRELSDIFDQED